MKKPLSPANTPYDIDSTCMRGTSKNSAQSMLCVIALQTCCKRLAMQTSENTPMDVQEQLCLCNSA